jgi:rhodanese-related sulfurtransferase
MLREKGYAGVYVLQGGLVAWEEAGFPIEKSMP